MRLNHKRLERYILSKAGELLGALGRMIRRRRLELAILRGEQFNSYFPEIASRMWVDTNTFFGQTVYVNGTFEPHIVSFLRRFVKPGMCCIDAGANVGYMTLLMAKLVGDSGRVVAFEPTPQTAALLIKNCALNCLKCVDIENSALSDRSGDVSMHVGPSGYDVYNSINEIGHPMARNKIFKRINVHAYSLDDYIRIKAMAKVDCIKIDVEGAELLVLNGLEETVVLNPNIGILIEMAEQTVSNFGYTVNMIQEWLSGRGFLIKVIGDGGVLHSPSSSERWRGQMIFAHRDRYI